MSVYTAAFPNLMPFSAIYFDADGNPQVSPTNQSAITKYTPSTYTNPSSVQSPALNYGYALLLLYCAHNWQLRFGGEQPPKGDQGYNLGGFATVGVPVASVS